MSDHGSYAHNQEPITQPKQVVKSRPEKSWGRNRIRTHDVCDTATVPYQLRYQANWGLAMLLVRNIPVEGEEHKWIYESSYIWTGILRVQFFL